MRSRRELLRDAARLLLGAAVPAGKSSAKTTAAARVIVIGGGFGGSTCAGWLRRLAPQIEVTLIEPRSLFYTGPFSNEALAGLCEPGDIAQGPAGLAALGVSVIAQAASEIDCANHRVQLTDGRWLQADRLVVAPGVAMRWDRIEGLHEADSDRMPHAWLGDAQLPLLRSRLAAVPRGGSIVIAAPPNPYRCPPGPYERASLFAWTLAQRGGGKVFVLDAKDDFSKRPLFQLGWDRLYPGLIEWHPRASGGELVRVDVRRGRLYTRGGETLHPDLACVIPPQQAAAIAQRAGLTDDSGWCPVRASDFQSTLAAGVHVLGDAAAAAPMPKSAFAANSQAKLCAVALAAELGDQTAPEVMLLNTCYSLLAPDWGISVGGVYGLAGDRLATLHDGMSPLGGDAALRKREARNAWHWYTRICADSFAR